MNKKLLLIVGVCAIVLTGCVRSAKEVCVKNEFIHAHTILTHDYKATPALKRVFALAGVALKDDSLASVNEAAQAAFLRPAGKERWETEKNQAYEANRAELIAAMDAIGLLKEIAPTQQEYTYGLFLGATVEGMRERLAYAFKTMREMHVRVKHIVIWVGERPLDAKIESEKVLLTVNTPGLVMNEQWVRPLVLPGNEADAMKLIEDQVKHPAAYDSAEKIWVRVPMKQKPDGTFARPTTGDTALAWMATNPEPGSCIVFSSQPHVGYQHTVVRTYLPASFSIDTVGCGVANVSNIAVYLDALARCLYQENERLKQCKAAK